MKKLILLHVILLLWLPAQVWATVFTVTSAADAGTGTGTSGDLRYCITQANAAAGPHTIQFAIPPAGSTATITLTNDLPSITNSNILINGNSQTGNNNLPGVILVRASGNNGFNIFVNPPATVSNVTIKGFIIQGFQNGINVSSASSIKIYGCWINVNAAGTGATAGGQNGINLDRTTSDTIGGPAKGQRNVILATSLYGINTTNSTCSRLVIKNNFIGVLPNGTGTAATGTTMHGINLNGAPYCTIGGTLPMERNVIAWTGSNGDGILADAGSHHARIIGNLIGTDSTGTVPYVIGKEGIFVQGNPTSPCTAPVINFNTIVKAGAYGIHIISTDSATIKGNKIGVNINGTGTAFGNTIAGIYITGQVGTANSKGHLIGGSTATDRNIISGNGTISSQTCSSLPDGIVFENVSNSFITGNYIGVDASGITALGNSGSGILLQTGTTNITIGGLTAGERNVICANGFACTGTGGRHGIQLYGSNVTANIIEGNYIGVGADGTTAIGNNIDGVSILQSYGNTIGGTSVAARNIVSANSYGIHIQGSGAPPNTMANLVLNNYVGTDYTGTVAKGNKRYGVVVDNGAGSATTPNYIGQPGAGNLISGNLWAGIALQGNGSGGGTGSQYTNIFANTIGLNAGGSPLANDTGIVIREGSNSNFIGSSTVAGATNTIAYNTNNGLWINGASTNKNWISKNSFYCNGNSYPIADVHNKGINLNGSGNNNYPAPVILAVGSGSSTTTLAGTAPANAVVEIFGIEPCVTCPAPPVTGVSVEGKTYVATVSADAAGNWTWSPAGGLGGSYTATATEPTGTYRNTSEFATCGFISLPVTLISFTGYKDKDKVNLYWATGNEKDNSTFIVERSFDGITFTDLDVIPGYGTSDIAHAYSYQDDYSGSEIVYYRLRQVDLDGKNSLSEIIEVSGSGKDAVSIYPIPASGELTVRFSLTDASGVTIEVVSVTGSVVLSTQAYAGEGYSEKKLDLSELSAGVYLVHFTTSSSHYVTRFEKR